MQLLNYYHLLEPLPLCINLSKWFQNPRLQHLGQVIMISCNIIGSPKDLKSFNICWNDDANLGQDVISV